MNIKRRLRLTYIASDYLTSFIGLFVFNIIRYYNIPPGRENRSLEQWLFHDFSIVCGMILFPVVMLLFYAVSGYYNDVREKSRLDDLRNSFSAGFVGMLVFYFITLINDYLPERIHNYELLLVLWVCLSLPVLAGRSVINRLQRRRLRAGKGGYTAVIVGTAERADALVRRLQPRGRKGMSRFKIIGRIDPENSYVEIVARIGELGPDAIIVVPHPGGVQATTELISRLYPVEKSIYITPDLYQLLTSRTRMTDVVSEPLIDITRAKVSPFTTNIKRISDVAGSVVALTLFSPLLAVIAVAVKLDSRGPVFYSQERIGYHKRPFRILKFRTMRPDAENEGPALSAEDDPRVTRVGRFLRKYRLDELPQFWNVLKGDMSLVGPRPERKYYIDLITERVPHYSLIHQVRPGITSWGMVKYGYASDIDQMVERLYYDLLYIENVSFGVDMKIIFHTINTVISGRGL